MKSHEEILDPYAFDELTYGSANPCKLITQSDALNAMQQAVDQALAWVPVDANNLTDEYFLLLDIRGNVYYGQLQVSSLFGICAIWNGMLIENITHYFDPAKLKTP